MGMQVRDGHVTTVQGQICPGPCLIGLIALQIKKNISTNPVPCTLLFHSIMKCIFALTLTTTNIVRHICPMQ